MSKSNGIVFPYGIQLHEGVTADIFPAAEVLFATQKSEWISLFLVIDSGATISALPQSDAPMFGIDVETGMPLAVSGVSARPLTGWKHEIPVRFAHHDMILPVVFLKNSPRILGRARIFPQFIVIFEEAERRSAFLREETPQANLLKNTLDKI